MRHALEKTRYSSLLPSTKSFPSLLDSPAPSPLYSVWPIQQPLFHQRQQKDEVSFTSSSTRSLKFVQCLIGKMLHTLPFRDLLDDHDTAHYTNDHAYTRRLAKTLTLRRPCRHSQWCQSSSRTYYHRVYRLHTLTF